MSSTSDPLQRPPHMPARDARLTQQTRDWSSAAPMRGEPELRSSPTHAPGRGSPSAIFRITPPYEERSHVRPGSATGGEPLPFGSILGLEITGTSLHWTEIETAIHTLRRRHVSAPIVLMIDPRTEDLLFVASRVARLPVRAVLFRGEPISAALRQQLTHPANLPEDVVEWLMLRGIRLTPTTAHMIRQIFLRAADYREVVPLLRDMGNPESSARFRCRKKRLPSPGRWLHAARALSTAFRIQSAPDRSLLSLAHEAGYGDHSALSNQMQRVFRMRPGEIRKVLGWEWLLDRWLAAEAGKHRSASPGAPA